MPILLVHQIELYQQAVDKLLDAINHNDHSEYLQDSILQRFEFCIELARKTGKKLLERQGYSDLSFPRQVLQAMHQSNLITDITTRQDFLDQRNTLSHCYGGKIATDIYEYIVEEDNYLLFQELAERFNTFKQQTNT